jgi:hypothetical protein
VAYLWSETASANISSRLPHARIIMILRDPSERAFSQYLHQLSVGLTRSTFREHVERCMRHRERKLGGYYPFLEVGLYSRQVRRYLDIFRRKNIQIYWYEEAWRQPARLLEDVFTFLNVDSTFHADTSQRILERRAPRFAAINYAVKQFAITHKVVTPSWLETTMSTLLFRNGAGLTMQSADRQYLIHYYREDILNLAHLLNHDLSAWLT